MIFNTWMFAAFATIVFVLYWYVVPKRARALLLIVSGCVFYSAAVPAYLLLIVGLAAATYATVRALLAAPPGARRTRRAILAAGVGASVAVLVAFKYSKLFALTFDSLCSGGCAHLVPNIIVPLAISFFTFEFVHVVVDVYLGKLRRVTLPDFAIFTLFFPTMVAGPIKRYQNFVPQIGRALRADRLDGLLFATGLFRIVMGLAKKAIIADSMTPLTQPLLSPGSDFTRADYWAGALAYTAKIYFDFSGYSDIAIGMALLLGFQILENFDRPYWATNISLFWRRWHMSLSSWIRDYIFIPLGGSRRGRVYTLGNLAVVMALAGLWHGAAWHFVVWGLWHGIGLGAHRVYDATLVRRLPAALRASRLLATVSVGLTFTFVVFGWVLFASPSTGAALTVYREMLGLPGAH